MQSSALTNSTKTAFMMHVAAISAAIVNACVPLSKLMLTNALELESSSKTGEVKIFVQCNATAQVNTTLVPRQMQ